MVEARHALDVAGVVAGRLEVVAGAHVAGEHAVGVVDGRAVVGDPVVAAVGRPQAVFEDKGLAGLEGAPVGRETGRLVVRVQRLDPAPVGFLRERAAGEGQPGLVEPVALAAHVGAPDQVREAFEHRQVLVAGAGELAVAGAQGVQHLVEGGGQFAELVAPAHRHVDVDSAGLATAEGRPDLVGRAQHVARHHQQDQPRHRAEDAAQPQAEGQHGVPRRPPQGRGIEAQQQHTIGEPPVLEAVIDQQHGLEHLQHPVGGIEPPLGLAAGIDAADGLRQGRVGQRGEGLVVPAVVAGGHHPERPASHQGDPLHVPRGAQGRQETPQVGRITGGLGGRADRRDDAIGALLDEGLEALEDARIHHADEQHDADGPQGQQRRNQPPAQRDEHTAQARGPRSPRCQAGMGARLTPALRNPPPETRGRSENP